MNRNDVITKIAAIGFAVAVSSAYGESLQSNQTTGSSHTQSQVSIDKAQSQVTAKTQTIVEKLALRAIGVDIT